MNDEPQYVFMLPAKLLKRGFQLALVFFVVIAMIEAAIGLYIYNFAQPKIITVDDAYKEGRPFEIHLHCAKVENPTLGETLYFDCTNSTGWTGDAAVWKDLPASPPTEGTNTLFTLH